MLYLGNLSKSYGSFLAVNNLSLHVPRGDLFGFVGPNGAGKTTTIRMLCGLLKPNFGTVHINGYELRSQSEAVRRCIGYVPDFFGVYDNLKVKEYMEFYGSIYGIDDATVRKMTGDLLDLVNLADKEEVYVDTLSRGMKQRLCVARALLHNPQLLVLDEPSSGLDPRARVEMKELLMNLNSMGKTIIISSHILADIAEMCNSVGIMNRGRLVTAGKMEDILGMGRNEHHLIIQIRSEMNKAVEHMRELPEVSLVSVRENEIVINFAGTDEEVNRIMISLMQAGVMVGGYHREESNLETLFMQLTGEAMATQLQPGLANGMMSQPQPGLASGMMLQPQPGLANGMMSQPQPGLANGMMSQPQPGLINGMMPQQMGMNDGRMPQAQNGMANSASQQGGAGWNA